VSRGRWSDWWDLRLQPKLGTLEIRAMDAEPARRGISGVTATLADAYVSQALSSL
jgi:gamma-glutamyl:cysteine ligase YbdK (ATP-grasp superfamily)